MDESQKSPQYQALQQEVVRQRKICQERGETFRMTIQHGGDELWVPSIGETPEGVWRMTCVNGRGEESMILCHPLAFPLHFEFFTADIDSPERHIGFRLQPARPAVDADVAVE